MRPDIALQSSPLTPRDLNKRSEATSIMTGAALGAAVASTASGLTNILCQRPFTDGFLISTVLGGLAGGFLNHSYANRHNAWVDSARQYDHLDKTGQLLPENVARVPATFQYNRALGAGSIALNTGLKWGGILGAISGIFSLAAGESPQKAARDTIASGLVYGGVYSALTYGTLLPLNERNNAVNHYLAKAQNNAEAISQVERLTTARAQAELAPQTGIALG